MRTYSTTRVLLIGLVVVAFAALLPLRVSGYILGLLTVAYYFGVFAMSWDLLFGFAGKIALLHIKGEQLRVKPA